VIGNDILALILTLAAALIWLRLNNFAAKRGWISAALSRKIIHIGTGPIFVVCWLLFTNAPSARYLAALVPAAITLQFYLVGAGIIKDPAAVQSMSRSGDRREILRGPLYYGIVFVVITIFYWKDTPTGIVALMMMCGGDGLADIVGRRYGRMPIPWNKGKSLEGSLGVLLGGGILALLVLAIYIGAGIFPAPLGSYFLPVMIIALAATLVESLPFADVDNITVSLTGLILGRLLLW
jgi:phytol kinase